MTIRSHEGDTIERDYVGPSREVFRGRLMGVSLVDCPAGYANIEVLIEDAVPRAILRVPLHVVPKLGSEVFWSVELPRP